MLFVPQACFGPDDAGTGSPDGTRSLFPISPRPTAANRSSTIAPIRSRTISTTRPAPSPHPYEYGAWSDFALAQSGSGGRLLHTDRDERPMPPLALTRHWARPSAGSFFVRRRASFPRLTHLKAEPPPIA